jgi:site-specific DNA-methyltransferase (adenine-specific)
MTIQLFQGDCLGDSGLSTLENKSVDMICCDPPYAITGNEWDTPLDLKKLFYEYLRVIKDNGAIVLFSCQPFTTDLINAGRKYFKYELIWEKSKGTDFLNSKRKPLRNHENILVFAKKQTTYNPQMTQGTPYTRAPAKMSFHSTIGRFLCKNGKDNTTGLRFPKTVLKFAMEQGKHTTQKPVPLIEWLIKTYSNEGDLIVDNTMGSGTTAVACINTGRRFIGWEMDEKYYNIANERVKQQCCEKKE